MPEALGFLASGLVLLTFGMRAMLPMRLLAICSNLAFMGYGLSLDLTPVWALHGILLPLNLYRLHELHQRVRGGRGGPRRRASLDRLRPLVARRRFAAGEVLFRKGEPARELYYILKGRVRLRGLEGSIAQSDPLVGLGLSGSGAGRTATAICETDCELLVVSAILPDVRPERLRPMPAERRLPALASWFPLAAWARRREGAAADRVASRAEQRSRMVNRTPSELLEELMPGPGVRQSTRSRRPTRSRARSSPPARMPA